MLKAVFFDLFFTLINPAYSNKNEYDVINITSTEWENYAEDDVLYIDRALGEVKTEIEIVRKIAEKMPYKLTMSQMQEILQRREKRMKRALLAVDKEILSTLNYLRKENIKICLISNADIIDRKYWNLSPLAKYFDYAVFSCDVGLMKPDERIYRYAMKKIGVTQGESLFVGDGGANELFGAKQVGMQTVFTEYLDKKPLEKRMQIVQYADYQVNHFSDLVGIVNDKQ